MGYSISASQVPRFGPLGLRPSPSAGSQFANQILQSAYHQPHLTAHISHATMLPTTPPFPPPCGFPDVTLACLCRCAVMSYSMPLLSHRLDILINNAGVADFRPIEDTSYACWRRVMETNMDGIFLCTQAAIPALKATRVPSLTSPQYRVSGRLPCELPMVPPRPPSCT